MATMNVAGAPPAERSASVADLILGVWLFISAFAWAHTPAQRTNAWIVGVLFAVGALVAMRAVRALWAHVILSIWLFISVWALPHDSAATMWNDALVAIAVFVVSMVGLQARRRFLPGQAAART
jgi:uncharacterized membrane protein